MTRFEIRSAELEDGMKKNWIQALTLVLCAALLAAALWQGRRISELKRTLSGVQEAVI